MGKARENGVIHTHFHNPRAHSHNPHHTVDDRPYGGGPGMVMMPEPLAQCLRSIEKPGRMLVMSPGGRPFTQALARELAQEKDITLICGRYEGLDERLFDVFPLEPVSMGDAVLNGGETAALAILEAVSRLVPGFMGKEASGEEESFSQGLLEYPHYTRPENFEGREVPDMLRSGNHARIHDWRRERSLEVTLRRRPDLFATATLTAADAAFVRDTLRFHPAKNLFVCLIHYPVLLGEKNAGASSLTNLDVHDISRTACSYGLGGFYVATPLEDQRRILDDILRHWTYGAGGRSNPHRSEALRLIHPVALLEDALENILERTGKKPFVVGTSAQWPQKQSVSLPSDVRQQLEQTPVLLCFGTGHGLAPEALEHCDTLLRPLLCFNHYNHLSVRAAAAITIERILGDIS